MEIPKKPTVIKLLQEIHSQCANRRRTTITEIEQPYGIISEMRVEVRDG
jgi:hypothetical protein